MASGPITSWQIDGETRETVTDFIFLGSKITADGDCSHAIKRHLLLGRKAMTNFDSILKEQRHHIANKGPYSQSYGFSSSHVRMCELVHKESRVLKNWYFRTVVLEKTPKNPLDCKGIKPVNPKGKRSWIFIGRTDSEAEAPILCPPDEKSWLIGKDPDAGKDWGQEEKASDNREWGGWMASPALWTCVWASSGYSPWGCKESDTTEWLNNNWQQELLRGDLECCHILDPLNLYENVFLNCPLNGRRKDHKLAESSPTHS